MCSTRAIEGFCAVLPGQSMAPKGGREGNRTDLTLVDIEGCNAYSTQPHHRCPLPLVVGLATLVKETQWNHYSLSNRLVS